MEVGATLRWATLDLLGIRLDQSPTGLLDRGERAAHCRPCDALATVALAGEDAADPPVRQLGQPRLVGLAVLDVGQLGGRTELAPPDALVAVVDEHLVHRPPDHVGLLGVPVPGGAVAHTDPLRMEPQAPASAPDTVVRLDQGGEVGPGVGGQGACGVAGHPGILAPAADSGRADARRRRTPGRGAASVGVTNPGSGDDAEPTGPGDLLARGQRDLQETEGLELTSARQPAGVDRAQAARRDDAGEQRLRVGVVARDEHGGRQRADGAGGEGAGERGVERLEHRGVGQGRGDLGGGRAVGGHRERVEGLEVQRVGDVDDHLAGERGTTRLEDRRDGRVGHGQHDDVAERGVEVVLAEQVHGVTATARDRRDGLAHVAGADDGEVGHGVLLCQCCGGAACAPLLVATTNMARNGCWCK